jgi:L-seryl-tRNA(Ser) seleniumtransferase
LAAVDIEETASQIGSGALPLSLLPSAALTLTPAGRSGKAVELLARRLRELPVPVIGRIEAGRIVLDLRCLEDETEFVAQLQLLPAGQPAT